MLQQEVITAFCNLSMEEKLQINISDINIPIRIVNALNECDVYTVEDLLEKHPNDILDIPNISKLSLDKIYAALEEIGFFRKRES